MPLGMKKKQCFFMIAVLCACTGMPIWSESNPQHSTTEAPPKENLSDATSDNPSEKKVPETPIASVNRKAPEPPPAEIVDGLKEVKFSRPTLEKIETAFSQQKVVDRKVFESVVNDLKQKDPNFTENQAQELRRLYDSRLGAIGPEKIGPQLSAAARKVLESQGQGGLSNGGLGNASATLNPDQSDPSKAPPGLDSDFFSKGLKDSESESKKGDEKENPEAVAEAKPGADNKQRTELLDALKLVLASKDKDKDKDDGEERGSDRGEESALPPPSFADAGQDDEQGEDPLSDTLDRQNQNQNQSGMNPLALAALQQSKNNSSDSEKSKKDEDDEPKSAAPKEKKSLVPPPEEKVTKLPEEKPEPDPLQPPPEDLLSAAQNLGNAVVPNKVPLPALPPPGAGGGFGGLPPGLGQNDPAMGGAGMMGGMGAGMMGGGGGGMGGGLPSAFQGDPFGSVGMEPMAGGTTGFNYLRMAEFGSAGSGGESTAVAEGSGYGDGSVAKRSVSIADEIRATSTDEPNVSIVERYVGKVEAYVCGAPEAERVAVCAKWAEKKPIADAK
jgi:hypothetical protein